MGGPAEVDVTLILWGHALAALLFGTLALAEVRGVEGRPPRHILVVALAVTSLWALIVAGIGAGDPIVHLLLGARNLAWLGWLIVLIRHSTTREGISRALAALCMVVALVTLLTVGLAIGQGIAAPISVPAALAAAMEQTRLALVMMAALGSLVLVQHLAGAQGRAQGGLRLALAALGVMWGLDLLLTAVTYVEGWVPALAALRGFAMAAVAGLLAAAGSRADDAAAPALSRTAAMRSLASVAVLIYAATTALVAHLAAAIGGSHGRIYETAVVFGAAAALLALASTPWLRAWTRVKVAKHLFRHRYDYRTEWQRFTATLGDPGPGGDPLGVRIVRAVADLTDSPAGLLLAMAEDERMIPAAAWNCDPQDPDPADLAFARHLATGRIVALDVIRADAGGAEAACIPAALLADPMAWVVVPLLHGERLAGAIVLARPPVDRALDWEDLDLLRVVGRQAASYLAEDRAHAALADAARFEEFNRRFAFLLHDIKNVASQVTLVARNAERHADNAEFRADMVATLRESGARMTALLARLGQHDASRPEPLRAVDATALVARAAAMRRAQHPVEVEIMTGEPIHVMAAPGRLAQVLDHLIQNAVEASDRGVPVCLRVEAGDGTVAIEVIDRGSGMSPGFMRDQLFRPFVSTKPNGFGIGAYEARELVRAMDGRLDVSSREGEGTRFRILLATAAAATLDAAA